MIEPLGRFVVRTTRPRRFYSSIPVCPVVILRRSHYVEKTKAPEHRPFHRRHNKLFAYCLGVDAKQNFAGVHQEKPRCKAGQPGESPPVIALDRELDSPKLLDVAEGLRYLHANHITHGNLKGVGIFFESFWAPSMTLNCIIFSSITTVMLV